MRHLCLLVLCGIAFIFNSVGMAASKPRLSSRPHLSDGTYEGVMRRYSGNTSNIPVSIRVTLSDENSASLEIRDLQDSLIESAHLSWNARGGLQVVIPRLGSETYQLNRTIAKRREDRLKCYTGHVVYFVDACISEQKMIFNVTHPRTHQSILSLSGKHVPDQLRFSWENPRDFTLKDAVTTALTKNFDSRIEFEHLMQAKHTLKAAYLNLLPHLNMRGVSTLASLNPMNFCSFLGQFTPFLLPTRWMQLHEVKDQKKIEEITMALMRADLAVSVEDLAYIMERDRDLSEFYTLLLKNAHELLDSLQEHPDYQKLRAKFEGLFNAFGLSQTQQNWVLRADRRALSQMLGFHNPETVQNIILENEAHPLGSAQEQNPELIANAAVRRSLEVVQIGYLIDVSRTKKKELYFNWMDGEMDSKLAFSAGVLESIAIGQSQIDELVIKQEKIHTEIYNKAIEVVESYNLAVRSYPFVKKEWDNRWQALKQLYDALTQGGAFEASLDIKGTYKAYLESYIDMQKLIANYRISRSKIDRMLLNEYYSDLQRHLPREEVSLNPNVEL